MNLIKFIFRCSQKGKGLSTTVEALNLRGPLANNQAYITYFRPTRESKSSLGAESDELGRYKDVAL